MGQDWVSEWNGWRSADQLLGNSSDDAVAEAVAQEVIQNFARIALQNVDVIAKRETSRRNEVEAAGKRIGVGLVHGNVRMCPGHGVPSRVMNRRYGFVVFCVESSHLRFGPHSAAGIISYVFLGFSGP